MKRTCSRRITTCPDVSGIGDQRKLNTNELKIGNNQNLTCDTDGYRHHSAIKNKLFTNEKLEYAE